MTTLAIILLLLAGIILLVAEVMIIPGFGVGGLIGGALAIGALYLSYNAYGLLISLALAMLAFVIFLVLCFVVSHSSITDRLKLKSQIDAKVEEDNHATLAVGDRGIAATRLNLYGKVEIEGKRYEAKADRFIDSGEEVVITEIDNNYIFVKKP